jgi:hypothetical protein
MSGTSARDTCRIDWTIAAVKTASVKTCSGSARACVSSSYAESGRQFFSTKWTNSARVMDEMAILRLAVAASLMKLAAAADSLASPYKCQRAVWVSATPSNHQKLSPKLLNISTRFASISSAEGACPYLANVPRPVLKGMPDDCSWSDGARSRSRTSHTYPSGETPCAFAWTFRAASSF